MPARKSLETPSEHTSPLSRCHTSQHWDALAKRVKCLNCQQHPPSEVGCCADASQHVPHTRPTVCEKSRQQFDSIDAAQFVGRAIHSATLGTLGMSPPVNQNCQIKMSKYINYSAGDSRIARRWPIHVEGCHGSKLQGAWISVRSNKARNAKDW